MRALVHLAQLADRYVRIANADIANADTYQSFVQRSRHAGTLLTDNALLPHAGQHDS